MALHADTKFLGDFAPQCRIDGLSRLDFATGELPQPTLVTPGVASSQQHLSTLVAQYGHRDVDSLSFGTRH